MQTKAMRLQGPRWARQSDTKAHFHLRPIEGWYVSMSRKRQQAKYTQEFSLQEERLKHMEAKLAEVLSNQASMSGSASRHLSRSPAQPPAITPHESLAISNR